MGSDAGEIANIGNYGVKITHPDFASEVLSSTRPSVAIMATRSFLKDSAAQMKICAQNRVNVITIGEEAFYSWNTDPVLTQELDMIFR